MSERATQECPICGATQPLASRTCSICGAVLPGERTPLVAMPPVETRKPKDKRPRYDPAVGDDDLFVGDLGGRMWRLLLVAGIVLALVLGIGIGVLIGRQDGDDDTSPDGDNPSVQVEGMETPLPSVPPGATSSSGGMFVTMTPAGDSSGVLPATPTSMPNSDPFGTMPTVTPLPPSPTSTPTPGPCYQTAKSGDTVLGLAIVCGHRDMDVIPLILDINDMESANELREGQTLEIPWPTPTGGPPTQPPAGEGAGGGSEAEGVSAVTTPEAMLNEFGTPDALVYYSNIEPTLRPGLSWHQIQAGETIVSIAYDYATDVETLSQINPEISFLQCDYGMTYGGENCSVMLYEGQRLRVPVAIPTATPTATPNGTFTPTPTATATYNAPYLLAPENNTRFMADEIVTLRWGGTGTLGAAERYLVRVEDLDEGVVHTALVRETAYTLPGGWQPDDGERHTFHWTVAVAVINDSNTVVSESYLTDPRVFTWNSR